MENTLNQSVPTLQAGYAKLDITPSYQVGLGGYQRREPTFSGRCRTDLCHLHRSDRRG